MARQEFFLFALVVLGLASCHESAPLAEGPAVAVSGGATSAAASSSPSAEWLKPVTAKVYLAKSREMAKAWHADADLYQIATSYAQADGTASPKTDSSGFQTAWEYLFYSKPAGKVFKVDVTEKGLQTREDFPLFPPAAFSPLPDDFVDSDRALEPARSGKWKLAYPVQMQLSCMASAKPSWEIQSASGQHNVEAISGKVIM